MGDNPEEELKTQKIVPLDEDDIALLKTYARVFSESCLLFFSTLDSSHSQGLGPYAKPIKQLEDDLKSISKAVNDLKGIKESDTGLAPTSLWSAFFELLFASG